MKMYQISTLQALALGYTKSVTTVAELVEHGDIGIGTFENVNGEMIVADGRCYRAKEDGSVVEASQDMGVPFASVVKITGAKKFPLEDIENIQKLKEVLTLRIEEDFGLNSMHVGRIDGVFRKVSARSESAYESQHVDLKDILSETQKDFVFEDIEGTLVCIYYPDYMDGINASGWHIHFISADHTKGGHVFDIDIENAELALSKISDIEIKLPSEPSFDTYSLKEASGSDIKKVEQGSE